MIRTLDGTFLTTIANHPCVRPHLGDGKNDFLDFRPLVANPDNITLQGERGAFFLQMLEPALYEAHSVFLPKAREAPRLAREGFRYLFTQTPCMEVVSKVPDGHKAADGLAKWMGLQEIFHREGVSHRSLTFDRWKARDPGLLAFGASLGLPAFDEARVRAFSASLLMVRVGNAAKAVWTYNRWAMFVGLPKMEMLSQSPLLIRLDGMLFDGSLTELESPCL